MRPYETRSTIMTSNRPLEDWGKLIGDVPFKTSAIRALLQPLFCIRQIVGIGLGDFGADLFQPLMKHLAKPAGYFRLFFGQIVFLAHIFEQIVQLDVIIFEKLDQLVVTGPD